MQHNFFPLIFAFSLILISLWVLRKIGIWKIKSYPSPILGKVNVSLKFNNGEKILSINNYDQGISLGNNKPELSYFYRVAKSAVDFCQHKNHPQTLMLGLGANTVSGLINKLNPKIHQTLVEIDSQIIQACRDYFNFNELQNYDLMIADVYQLIKNPQAFDKKFDVIIVDVFTGNPPFVSLESNQPSFIEQLLPWLKKDGMVIFNRPGHTKEARDDSVKLEIYLKTLFKNTKIYDVMDPVRKFRNNVITAWGKLKI
jgi:spermidine synthase